MAKAVVAVLNERYGLDLVWRTRVQVESDPDKQDFLMREHPDVEMLVPDMVCLASAMPTTTATTTTTTTTTYIGGHLCSSVTSDIEPFYLANMENEENNMEMMEEKMMMMEKKMMKMDVVGMDSMHDHS